MLVGTSGARGGQWCPQGPVVLRSDPWCPSELTPNMKGAHQCVPFPFLSLCSPSVPSLCDTTIPLPQRYSCATPLPFRDTTTILRRHSYATPLLFCDTMTLLLQRYPCAA